MTVRLTLLTTMSAIAMVVASAGVHAQSRGQLQASPQRTAPAANGAIANRPVPGAPSASGLASPFPPTLPSLAVPGTSTAGELAPEANRTGADPGLANAADASNTAVMGAGAYGSRGMTRGGTGPVTAADVARSFLNADGNRDGDLTRAEAMRLSILPLTFEEMDADHNDILTRSEYENALL